MTETRIDRRSWLAGSAASVLLASRGSGVLCAQTPDPKRVEFHKQELLRKLLYRRGDLDAWLAGKAFPFSKYDAELGYLHIDRDFDHSGAASRIVQRKISRNRVSACSGSPEGNASSPTIPL